MDNFARIGHEKAGFNGTWLFAENGEIVDTAAFSVKCGDGKCVTFLEVQPEGKKRMKTDDFLRGKKLDKGEKLV